MGTNYYLRRVRPREVHDEYHVCKLSAGWPAHFQSDDWYHPEDAGNPVTSPMMYHASQLRWPDADNGEVVPRWGSVGGIRALLRSGEWQLSDEYGAVSAPGRESLDLLGRICAHPGDRDEGQFDYRDPEGYGFSRSDFR